MWTPLTNYTFQLTPGGESDGQMTPMFLTVHEGQEDDCFCVYIGPISECLCDVFRGYRMYWGGEVLMVRGQKFLIRKTVSN